MPPRKKAKASAASTPLGDGQPGTPQTSNTLAQDELLNDPWEDEQEIQLLKSMMKWKPTGKWHLSLSEINTNVTGLHKHFRMISIHNDMTSHGFATEKVPHTRIPGIWKKLDQLYDLETLDARENEFAFSDDPDPTKREEAETLPDFELPEDEFGEMMWQSRFRESESPEASSPPIVPIEDEKALYMPGLGLLKDLPDGVHSHRAESVAESTPPTKKSTRSSRSVVKSGKKAGAVAAKNSKAQSTVSDSEEEENEEDDDDESSSESEEEDSAPTTRRTNRTKAKPAPRRTRKR